MSIKRWPRVLSNHGVQLFQPDVKIFFIGFNKCATTSIHQLMLMSGIWSDHWERKGENIALAISAVISDREKFRRYMRRSTAYSDLSYFSDNRIIEGNSYFKEYHSAYPNAYFVLNDREVEAWIRSRASHRKGKLMERSMAFHGASSEEVKDIWREHHAAHVEAVLKHFSGHDRFLHFRIDRDPPKLLTSFLAPTFRIDPDDWQRANETKRLASSDLALK